MTDDAKRLRERTRALINQLGDQADWKRGTGVQVAKLLGIGPSLVSLLHADKRQDIDVQWSTVQRIVAATRIKEEFFTGRFAQEPYYADFLTRGYPLELGELVNRRATAPGDPRTLVTEILRTADHSEISPEMLAAVHAHVDQLSRFTTVTEPDVTRYLTGLRTELLKQLRADAHGISGAAAKRRAAVSKLAASVSPAGQRRRRQRA